MTVSRTLLWIFCSAFLLVPGSTSAPQPRARPKLVVLLVVDQMRGDYIEQYGRQWTKGLRRLVEQGARFREAAYSHWMTVTCAGHATLSTGTVPATHGMIQNSWWDRDARAMIACTQDAGVQNAGISAATSPGDSPRQLRVPTLPEELRRQAPGGSRAVALSLKARSAIMMAGRSGDAVVWHSASRGWQTSTYYSSALPGFVEKFIRANPVERDFERLWTKSLPDSGYLFEDDAEGERPGHGRQRTFPHRVTNPRNWQESPFSDAYLGALAAAAVDALRLGQRRGTDFLGVSFSALDLVGHDFGPRSHEVQDVLVQLDATIGRLLDHLDRVVGPENYVVALAADHGVSPIPEQVAAEGTSAGRISTVALIGRVEEALEPLLGRGPHIASVVSADVYFRPRVYDRIRRDPRIVRTVKEALLETPGVWRVFPSDEVRRPATSDAAQRAVAAGYHPGRSGDVIWIARPYWISSSEAATHGTGHPYDARVPVILMGAMFRAGEYAGEATPADVAPTLAHVAGIEMKRAEGRVLAEALVPAAAPNGGKR